MKKYEFIPNEFARKNFNLSSKSYAGKAISPLLMEVLGGEKNYDRSMTRCNPDIRVSTVTAITNTQEIEARIMKGYAVPADMPVRKDIGVLKVKRLGIF